jgi:hypothetical protein
MTSKKDEYNVKELAILVCKIGARVGAIEMERRKDKIAVILRDAYKGDKLNEKIESFAKSALPYETIHDIVTSLRKRK